MTGRRRHGLTLCAREHTQSNAPPNHTPQVEKTLIHPNPPNPNPSRLVEKVLSVSFTDDDDAAVLKWKPALHVSLSECRVSTHRVWPTRARDCIRVD